MLAPLLSIVACIAPESDEPVSERSTPGDGDCEAPTWTADQGFVGAETPVWTKSGQLVTFDTYGVHLYDGQDWSLVAPGGRIQAAWADALDNVWIATEQSDESGEVGTPGGVWHWDGAALTHALGPASGTGFSGVAGDGYGQIWATEKVAFKSCSTSGLFCDGNSPVWSFDGQAWTLENEELQFGHAQLTYQDGTLWAHADHDLGNRGLARLTGQGWAYLDGYNSHDVWTDPNDGIWSFSLKSHRVRHLESNQTAYLFNLETLGIEDYDPEGLFGHAMAPRPGHLPLLLLEGHDAGEGPFLYQLTAPKQATELGEFPDARGMIASEPDELFLTRVQQQGSARAWTGQVESVDLSGAQPVVSTIDERAGYGCTRWAFGFDDEIVAFDARGAQVRDAQGQWARIDDYSNLGSNVHWWLADADDGWGARRNDFFYFDGDEVTVLDGAAPFNWAADLWGFSATEIYVAAQPTTDPSPGAVLRWDGSSWTVDATASQVIAALHGVDGTLFAIGYATVMRRHGNTWTSIANNQSVRYERLFAAAPDDLWVSVELTPGDTTVDHAIWRWDDGNWVDAGATWPVLANIERVTSDFAGTGPDDVWIHLDGNRLVHFDGTDWTEVESPAIEDDGAGSSLEVGLHRIGDELLIDDCVRIWSLTCDPY